MPLSVNYSERLDNLKETLLKNHPETNVSLLEEAFETSKEAHEGQNRASGEPYFTHPLAVAEMLAQKGLDETIVCSALMHDMLEDTKVKPAYIKQKFGKEIYNLVSGLTKLDKVAFKSRKEHSIANIIKTIGASSKDVRVLIIKLYDKLHNMKTLSYLPAEKQKRIAADALTVYVPLSHYLGIHELKYELEDLCFKTLEAEKFKELTDSVQKYRSEKSQELKKVQEHLNSIWPDTAWKFEEKCKSLYSTYSKMIAHNKQVRELNDLVILKIIVGEEYDCYAALGRVHAAFKPIPQKFKDYIAIPEYNIYQSLHTQVIGPAKKPLKVYIFTQEMNKIADLGVLHLMKEREKNLPAINNIAKRFSKINTPEMNDGEDIADSLHLNFHNSAMIVFSENGKVVNLPGRSTMLDFAFFADERLAKYTSKGEINGKMENLWKKLEAGDRVKIHYAMTKQLNSNWLSFVNSAKVKRTIEKEITKNNLTKKNVLARITLEAVDRPGLLADQTEIISKNGLDMEGITGTCKTNKKTCATEIYVRNSTHKGIQKAIRELRDLKDTINISVDYLQ